MVCYYIWSMANGYDDFYGGVYNIEHLGRVSMKQIFLLLGFMLVLSSVAYALDADKDSVFPELKANDNNGESVFVFNNPAVEPIPSDTLKFEFNEVCGRVANYEVTKKSTCQIFKDVLTGYSEICQDIEQYNNETEKLEIKRVCQNVPVYEKRAFYEPCYKPVVEYDSGDNELKITADLEFGDCGDSWGYKIDWIPLIKIDGVDIKKDAWAWYNQTFTKCKNITISSDTTQTLYNYTAYVHVAGDNDMQTDLDDIRFINNSCGLDGTLLSYELESGNSSAGGEFWVRLPQLTNSGVSIAIYYGNTEASSGADSENAWDINFLMVHHLEETDLDGGAGDIKDSSRYNQDGNTTGLDTSDSVTGIIGRGIYFDGLNDGIAIVEDGTLDITAPITMELWVKPHQPNQAYAKILSKASNTSWVPPYVTYNMDYQGNNDNKACTGYSTPELDTLCANIVASNNSWYYQVSTYDLATRRIFINGTLQNSGAETGDILTSNQHLYIGENELSVDDFKGVLDEARISNINRSVDYFLQNYNMVMNQSDFVTFGTEETRPNNAPTWTEAPTNQSFGYLENVNYDLNATDADLDTLYYYINDSGFNMNVTTGLLTKQTNVSDIGNYSLFANCTDGTAWINATFNIEIYNDSSPPTPPTTTNNRTIFIDLSTLEGGFVLFILVVVWLSMITIGTIFGNFAFTITGFLVGIMIGFTFGQIHPLIAVFLVVINGFMVLRSVGGLL